MSLIYCSFRKYLYSAYRRDWNFLGGEELFCQAKRKRNVEASLEVSGVAWGWYRHILGLHITCNSKRTVNL